MSTTESAASDEEPDARENASVYDFLYHDARRIGSFLSQFDDSGHLQQVRQTESVGKSRSLKVGAKGGLAVPKVLSGLSGETSFERNTSSEGKESAERVYDPLWSNALLLLDYLHERGLVQRDLPNARIGQFVIATGNLAILDLAILKDVWAMPFVKKLMQQGAANRGSPNRHSRRVERGKADASSTAVGIEGMLGLLGHLPHAVQARVFGNEVSAWCGLREDCLVVSSSDLLLKHGLVLSGTWSVLGILDATPSEIAADISVESFQTQLNSAVHPTGLEDTPIGAVMVGMASVARQLLGRPTNAFGLTPLLIFRSVSG